MNKDPGPRGHSAESLFSGARLADELSAGIEHTTEVVAGEEQAIQATVPWRIELSERLDLVERKEVLAQDLERRVNDPGFDRLAGLFREDLPAEREARLIALVGLAARYLDFRRGAMRYEVDFTAASPDRAKVNLDDPEIQKAVDDISAGFGLVKSSCASKGEYDGLIEPGGAGQSPLLRLKHGLEQKGPDGEPVKFKWIALLGSDRIVSDTERAKVQNYAPDAKTEFDLMVAAAETLLQPTLRRDTTLQERSVGYAYDNEHTNPRVRYYETADGVAVFVLNAPIPEGEVKANTGHTYDLLRFAAGKRLSEGKDVLLTSIAYVGAFQHVDAERLLGLSAGVSVETIGYSKDYALRGTDSLPEGVESEKRPPKEMLQEIKSYIDSLAKLKKSLES